MFGMLSVLAELQRELIVANTPDGLAAAAPAAGGPASPPTRPRSPSSSTTRATRPCSRSPTSCACLAPPSMTTSAPAPPPGNPRRPRQKDAGSVESSPVAPPRRARWRGFRCSATSEPRYLTAPGSPPCTRTPTPPLRVGGWCLRLHHPGRVHPRAHRLRHRAYHVHTEEAERFAIHITLVTLHLAVASGVPGLDRAEPRRRRSGP